MEMSKFGKRLIAAAEEAVSWARGEIALDVVEYDKPTNRLARAVRRHRKIVSKSCGCTFCDIGLVQVNGVHDEGNGVQPCGLATNDNFKCPIGSEGCTKNCGNYGCGN